MTATLAANAFGAFLDNDRHHDERGDRIGPPPSDGRIQQETAEEDGREPSAERGLCRVRIERLAAGRASDNAASAIRSCSRLAVRAG